MKIIVSTLDQFLSHFPSTARPIFLLLIRHSYQTEGVTMIRSSIVLTAIPSNKDKICIDYRFPIADYMPAFDDQVIEARKKEKLIEEAIRAILKEKGYEVQDGIISDMSDVIFGEPFQVKEPKETN